MKSLKVLLLIVLTLSMCAGNVYAKKTDNEELNLRWTREEIMGLMVTDEHKCPVGRIMKALEISNKLMMATFNPDELKLAALGLEGDILTVTYALGFVNIGIRVNISNYEADFAEYSKKCVKAALATREGIATKMTTRLEEVHINGIDYYCYIASDDIT
ncbi:MAG: hypothetical protein KAU58_01655, partial [Candidatus Omnitrophica bacterium]|nr:hypothetical protein [Candidatus Omnitrophota bacterium]